MAAAAPITIVSDFERAFGEGANPEKAESFRSRHAAWQQLAHEFGWELGIADAALVRGQPERLRGARVCFLDSPLLLPGDYRALWQRCISVLPSGVVCDSPADVESVLSLGGVYRALQAAEFSTVRTALIDVPDELDFATPADVDRLLGDSLEQAMQAAGVSLQAGVYVRGFYASMRSQHPAYFFAQDRTQLAATCQRVIRGLRKGFALAGLAVREYLDLEHVQVDADAETGRSGAVPLEIRLTFIGGRLASANFHGPFEDLGTRQQISLGERLVSVRLDSGLEAAAARLQQLGLPKNCVADVVYRKGASLPIISELNPLYSCGYRVPLARAWVQTMLAAELAHRAGYPPPGAAALAAAARQLAGDPPTGAAGLLRVGEFAKVPPC